MFAVGVVSFSVNLSCAYFNKKEEETVHCSDIPTFRDDPQINSNVNQISPCAKKLRKIEYGKSIKIIIYANKHKAAILSFPGRESAVALANVIHDSEV